RSTRGCAMPEPWTSTSRCLLRSAATGSATTTTSACSTPASVDRDQGWPSSSESGRVGRRNVRFSLVDEPWVPGTGGGRRREGSLRAAVPGGQGIDGRALDEPLPVVAVLRQVLLPVVLDALGVPGSREEWAGRWQRCGFDAAAVDGYLSEHAGRFELFDAV